MGEYYVYGHINPITNKFFYIGKGKGRRWETTRGRNEYWKRTVDKYGFSAIKLAENLTNEQAVEVEKQYIEKYGTANNGGSLVNMTTGGEYGRTGYKMPEHERHILSQRMKENKIWIGKTHNANTKKKMAVAATGRVKSKEEREKLSISNKGKTRTEDVRLNISKSHIGLLPTEETRKKLSESKKGILNPNYGKKTWNFGIPRTEECKQKIRAAIAARKQK